MPKVPKFRTLEEEAEFWDTHSLADFWDQWKPVEGPLIDERPPKKLVSMRFDGALIDAAKRIARTKGIGYQTLLRMWAYEGLAREVRRQAPPRSRAKKAG